MLIIWVDTRVWKRVVGSCLALEIETSSLDQGSRSSRNRWEVPQGATVDQYDTKQETNGRRGFAYTFLLHWRDNACRQDGTMTNIGTVMAMAD